MSGNALVPVDPTRPPAVRRPAPRYNLVSENITFTNRDDVRERLPDILGKALAFRPDVGIVEAEIRLAKDAEHVKRDVSL